MVSMTRIWNGWGWSESRLWGVWQEAMQWVATHSVHVLPQLWGSIQSGISTQCN